MEVFNSICVIFIDIGKLLFYFLHDTTILGNSIKENLLLFKYKTRLKFGDSNSMRSPTLMLITESKIWKQQSD